MAGGPPSPTALKLLRGNPRQRKMNAAERKRLVEAAPRGYVLADPALLVEWKREAAGLLRLGMVTEIDDGGLGARCVLEVRLRDMLAAATLANMQLDTKALIEVTKELRQLWSRFGMTPAD